MKELLSNPAFKPYVVCAVILSFNPFFIAGLTGAARGKYKTPAVPEDEKLSKNPYRTDTPIEVQRLLNAHRNALETIPIALLVGLLYVLAGASANAVMGFMGVIAAFRWFHTVAYLMEAQPWRTMSFAVAILATMGMMGHLLALVLA